jgi:DNA-binding NtrC family response regulator
MDASRTITRTHERRSDAAAAWPYLFLVSRCDAPLEPGARFALRGVDAAVIGRASALHSAQGSDGGARVLRIGVPDARMSTVHARIESVLGTWTVTDAQSKNGTIVDGVRTVRTQLQDGSILELGHSFFMFREALPPAEPAFLDARELRPAAAGMATLSPGFSADLSRLASYARARVPVLLQGETGTGKELMASAIHELSARPGPFVAVNCGALPAHLVEAELFGSRKGAYTGSAEDRPGFVRSSDRGTLLLDEIGDLPLSAQAALLRVLQEEEVVPVGASRPVKIDLRVVSATHRNLKALAEEERFRADLLARLDGATVVLPPLRERREDLGIVLGALLRKIAGERAASVRFTSEALGALLRHGWPLNVRELQKSLAGALALADDGHIELHHLPESVRAPREVKPAAAPVREEDRQLREDLVARLRESHGNVTATAKAMNKARVQIQRWLRRFGIDPASFR